MTVDYRALNCQTKKDVYPLPRIDDLLNKLSKAMCLSAINHKIELEPGATPPYRHQYRVSAAELAKVWCHLDEYLEKGWICPSSSPYGAPIVFISIKTGELHMMVNYRALNRQTKKDIYPLPNINFRLN